MEQSMAPILVTGGEGFLGKHVQDYLIDNNISYYTLDNRGSPDIFADLTKPGYLDANLRNVRLNEVGRIIHLAGVLGTHELFDDIEHAIDVNIKGTVKVLQFAAERSIPFTGVTMAHVWTNPYETTKWAAERLSRALAREYGFDVNWVTVYNAYGEYQAHGGNHPQKIIPTFATAAWNKEPIPIWGDGTQVVDLVYAGDVARTIYNFNGVDRLGRFEEAGYGIARPVMDVARTVWKYVNGDEPMPVQFLPMRRGEHLPTRDPIAENPIIADEPYSVTLDRTIDWYKP
jgi:UDP-glucose 4-epimerase